MSEKISAEIKNRVDEFAASMMEHVDSVRVFITVHDGASQTTRSYDFGMGNVHAQKGQVDEWLTMQREYERAYARRKYGETPFNE